MTINAFNLLNQQDYLSWRDTKLAAYPHDAIIVPIKNPDKLSDHEIMAIRDSVSRCNFVLYQLDNPDNASPETLLRFCTQLGLRQNDHNLCAEDIGVTRLQVTSGAARRYIPYTNKPLSWHTDGYYNLPSQQIGAWLLHCARAAESGGESEIMDHEIAYIQLRDADPDMIAALQRPQAMTIPANIEHGVEIRAEQTGPVFSYNAQQQRLHMRYSARLKNVIWYDDAHTSKAAAFLKSLFNESDKYRHRLKLQPGQGLLSNNTLHRRDGFSDAKDGPGRLLYRARYYNSISI